MKKGYTEGRVRYYFSL